MHKRIRGLLLVCFSFLAIISGCSGKPQEIVEDFNGIEATKRVEDTSNSITTRNNETDIEKIKNQEELKEEKLSSYVVSVSCGKNSGCGVLYRYEDHGLWIVSTAHLFEENTKEALVMITDQLQSVSNKIFISESQDIAFIFLEFSDDFWPNSQQYPSVSQSVTAYDSLRGGDEIIAVGCGINGKNNVYRGTLIDSWIYVEDFSQYLLYGNVYSYAGMSGGGVFDKNGNFIGMVCGNTREDGIFETVAIPINAIMACEGELLVNS